MFPLEQAVWADFFTNPAGSGGKRHVAAASGFQIVSQCFVRLHASSASIKLLAGVHAGGSVCEACSVGLWDLEPVATARPQLRRPDDCA